MKIFASLLVVLALAGSGFAGWTAFTVFQPCPSIGTITPLNQFANIRSGPENLGDRNKTGELLKGDSMAVVRRVGDWYETCGGEYISVSVTRFTPSTPTPAATPTKVTPVPTSVPLVIYVKMTVKIGRQRVDMGIVELRNGEPVGIELERVDGFPQPTATPTALP